MEKCDELAPIERARCYRAYAEQAISQAKNAATDEIRQGYLKMADDWLILADSIEVYYGRVPVAVAPEIASILRKQGQ
jgi:hypothetical protein